jgi:hypothetical protein
MTRCTAMIGVTLGDSAILAYTTVQKGYRNVPAPPCRLDLLG